MKSLAKSFAINVGVNTKWGGFRGPIFPNGSFEFIHIPWEDKYGMIDPPPKKYEAYRTYESYIKPRLKYRYTHILESPDFYHCTYASTVKKGIPAPANKHIFTLNPGEYLFFYATLDFQGEKSEKEDWINPEWGAYVVGLFKIDKIYTGLKAVLADSAAKEAFKEYTWFKSLLKRGIFDDAGPPWVKGIREESGLLEKAIPLSSFEDSKKWSDLARDLFTTSTGKKLPANAIFQTILKCEGECLDKLLAKCALRKINM